MSVPRAILRETRKHRGITLGHPAVMQGSPRTWYRIRNGREISIATVEGLPREWMLAYLAWHKARGRLEEAAALRRDWLAAAKENTRSGSPVTTTRG